MIIPRRADPAGSLVVRQQAVRMRRAEVDVPVLLSEKLTDRAAPPELVAEAERLEGEALEFRRLTRAQGTLTITDTAKVIGINPKRLVNWMIGNDWAFREGKDRLAAHQRRLDAGQLRQRIIRLYRSDGTETLGVSVLVTAKGLIALAKAITDHRAGPL